MRLALALIAMVVIVAACGPKICSRCLCEAGACDPRPSRTDARGAWIYPDQTPWPPSSQDPRDPGIFSRDWRYPNFYDGPRDPALPDLPGPTGRPKLKARPPEPPGDHPWL